MNHLNRKTVVDDSVPKKEEQEKGWSVFFADCDNGTTMVPSNDTSTKNWTDYTDEHAKQPPPPQQQQQQRPQQQHTCIKEMAEQQIIFDTNDHNDDSDDNEWEAFDDGTNNTQKEKADNDDEWEFQGADSTTTTLDMEEMNQNHHICEKEAQSNGGESTPSIKNDVIAADPQTQLLAWSATVSRLFLPNPTKIHKSHNRNGSASTRQNENASLVSKSTKPLSIKRSNIYPFQWNGSITEKKLYESTGLPKPDTKTDFSSTSMNELTPNSPVLVIVSVRDNKKSNVNYFR